MKYCLICNKELINNSKGIKRGGQNWENQKYCSKKCKKKAKYLKYKNHSLKKCKEYYLKNKDKIIKNVKKYYEEHKARLLLYKKGWRRRKYCNSLSITLQQYKEITKECKVCGFKELVDLHHIDMDRDNNNFSNLIGLCPNHHLLIHRKKKRLKELFVEEIIKYVKEKIKEEEIKVSFQI